MVMDFFLGNYKTVSVRLGLVIDDGRIHGIVDGVPIQMWFGPHRTHTGALLSRPASIDVSLATKGLIGKLGELFGGHAAHTGDAELDKVFSLKASDVARAAALFDADARRALLEVAKEGLHPAVDAHSIHLHRFSQGGLADSEQVIERDFHETARLAKIIGDSFAK